jgi:hypothetical protein
VVLTLGIAIISVTCDNGCAAAVPALLSRDALSVSGGVICARIPLAVTTLAMLMTRFIVIFALKKML